jgi:hypothetical protein
MREGWRNSPVPRTGLSPFLGISRRPRQVPCRTLGCACLRSSVHLCVLIIDRTDGLAMGKSRTDRIRSLAHALPLPPATDTLSSSYAQGVLVLPWHKPVSQFAKPSRVQKGLTGFFFLPSNRHLLLSRRRLPD